MIVWGGDNGGKVNSGGRYDPVSDNWVPTSTGPGPSPRATGAVWTGSRMLIWGGYAVAPGGVTYSYWGSGGQYDPVLDTWLPISVSGAPSPRSTPAVWTGSQMVVWGGYDGSARVATGGRYDPVADAWTSTSLSGAPAARSSHAAVWSGTELIVWGGWDGTSRLAAGGRYNPLLDAWVPLSQINAPPAVSSPVALWTGNRMLVWGGVGQGYQAVNTGGLYDPVYDSWRPASVTGAPSRRYGASGVWTGSRVIIWGGEHESSGSPFNTGGRYDPVSDAWLPTSLTGAPLERSYHSALWTGTRMVLWGGYRYVDLNPYDAFLSTGGIYDPVADSWAGTSEAGAPKGREGHASAWTGEKMLVWGGWAGSGAASGGGGSYCGVFPAHYYEDGDADGYGDSLSSAISCGQPAGYAPLPGDCASSNAALWAPPSEALNLRFSNATTLEWNAPAEPGAVSILYDTLRSGGPADFVGGGTCLAADSPLLSATDATVPTMGTALHYLVRSQNGCPSGSGPLGSSSAGVPRAGLNCP